MDDKVDMGSVVTCCGDDVEVAKDLGVEIVEPKVRVKRNRGLRKDIVALVSENPVITPSQVFEMVKNNSYGGDKPVSLNTVMSTMSQLKPKVL